MYKLIKNQKGEVFGAFKEENGFRISFGFDPDNTDYQAYLKWVEEGNTPLPADSSTEGATSSVVTEQEGTV